MKLCINEVYVCVKLVSAYITIVTNFFVSITGAASDDDDDDGDAGDDDDDDDDDGDAADDDD